MTIIRERKKEKNIYSYYTKQFSCTYCGKLKLSISLDSFVFAEAFRAFGLTLLDNTFTYF